MHDNCTFFVVLMFCGFFVHLCRWNTEIIDLWIRAAGLKSLNQLQSNLNIKKMGFSMVYIIHFKFYLWFKIIVAELNWNMYR